MTKTLIITEKPSQARDVFAAIGNEYGEILSALGHLLRLADPEEVNKKWKKWNYDLLQPDGGFYPLVKDTQNPKPKYLKPILAALKTVDCVIIATDKDREGQAIAQNILSFANFKGEVLRADFVAMDKKSLQEAFANLRQNSEYENLYASAVARSQLDQIANFSATRAVTLSLKHGEQKTALGVGRVKTPTIGLICERENAIKNFVPHNYYLPILNLSEKHTFSLPFVALEGIEFKTKDEAIIASKHLLGTEIFLSVSKTLKYSSPPKFLDLTTLQAKCSSHNLSPTQTLEVAQSLYSNHKITTYPRTESPHLPEIEIASIPQMMIGLKALDFQFEFDAPIIRKGKKGVYSDKALENFSHHAIIPNIKTVAEWKEIFDQLSDIEKTVFSMISNYYLAAISPDYEYMKTEISFSDKLLEDNGRFKISGTEIINLGWHQYIPITDKKEVILPLVKDGDTFNVDSIDTSKSTTKSPSRFTISRLPTIMRDIHKFVSNPELAETLKDNAGIGTGATRASIIDGLIAQKFMEVKKGQIFATDLAMDYFSVLFKEVPEILSPITTARMEIVLNQIANGEISDIDGVNKLLPPTIRLLEKMKKKGRINNSGKPTSKMIKTAKKFANGSPLSKDIINNFTACSNFITENIKKSKKAKVIGGSKPSIKQIAYAKSIASKKSLELSDIILKCSQKLYNWISENK